jgi:hypothetical protein
MRGGGVPLAIALIGPVESRDCTSEGVPVVPLAL